MKKLMLCAGTTQREGWITLDGNPANSPDILARIPPLPPLLLSKKWDAVEWVHGIGSLDVWDAREVIGQLLGILKPDGVLILEQPNLHTVAQEVVSDPSKAWWIFGDPTHRDPGMMNRWCYSPESLTEMLNGFGFSRVSVMAPQYHGCSRRDFRVEARP